MSTRSPQSSRSSQGSQSPRSSRRIGLFGGSFNPLHVGHVALARAALERCRLDEVWLMVSPQNPLKQDRALLDGRRRFLLAEKALAGVAGVKASDYELHLPTPSYTWNTLTHLSHDFPDCQFVLLIGGDNWAHFQRWRRWKDILWHYEVAVYPRGGHGGTFEAPLVDVSSTQVRERVRRGEPISGMVPAAIVPDVMQLYL